MTNAHDVYAKQHELEHARDERSELFWRMNGKMATAQEAAFKAADERIAAIEAELAPMQAEVGGIVYRIPEGNFPELEAKIAKLNKTAAKLDCQPIVIHDLEHETVSNKDGSSWERIWIALNGTAPKLNGWSFVATLEHDEGDTIIRRIPTFEGEVNLDAYRNATPENCDHCHTRRRRNDTYIVAYEDGSLKQVGSNCLADFLGHVSPHRIANWLEYLADLVDELGEESERDEYHGPREKMRYSTEDILSDSAMMIRTNGWTPKSRADAWTPATAELVESNLWLRLKGQCNRWGGPEWIDPEPADVEKAQKAIAWVRELSERDLENDYLYNLFTVVKKDSITQRQFGLACSAITAWERALEREVKRAEAKKGLANEHIGEIGERRIFTFTVVRGFHYEGNYGDDGYTKYILRDDDGRTLIWNTNSYDMEPGSRWSGKFTVKAHQEHNKFGKQTQITRPHKLEQQDEATDGQREAA